MVRAEHSSEIRHVDPTTNEITVHPGGEPCGYVIEVENGFTIYHAGDTGVFADMKFIGEYYSPDLALLPIGAEFKKALEGSSTRVIIMSPGETRAF